MSLGEIGRDDQELESDDHELGVDGNPCVLGIVATVSSQLSQKDIQLAMGPYSKTLQDYYCLLLLFLLTAHLPVQDVSVAAQTHFGAAPFTLQASVIAHLWPVIGH